MNGKKSKQIRAQAKIILVDWLKSLVDKEEANKITKENCLQLLPDQAYFYSNSAFKMQAYSLRWTYKKIKQFNKKYPHIPIEKINHEKLKWII
tara:strand:+ start:437 stop:715 length:279 start_codon:yes stop_codon:yes gene_type:complete